MLRHLSWTIPFCVVLLLSSSGDSASDDTGVSNVVSELTGTHRLSTATRTYSDGTIAEYGYTYSDVGRLITIDMKRAH